MAEKDFQIMEAYQKVKATLWEGGIRVPSFVRWPGKIKEGVHNTASGDYDGLDATILSAGNAKSRSDFPLDGIDLMPVLTGKEQNIEKLFTGEPFSEQNNRELSEWANGNICRMKTENTFFNLASDKEEKMILKRTSPTYLTN
jgi:arylsulfatase A-like enzyme